MQLRLEPGSPCLRITHESVSSRGLFTPIGYRPIAATSIDRYGWGSRETRAITSTPRHLHSGRGVAVSTRCNLCLRFRLLVRYTGQLEAQEAQALMPKTKSRKQVGLLLSDRSPLTPAQKKKLERELDSGKVKVRKKAKR